MADGCALMRVNDGIAIEALGQDDHVQAARQSPHGPHIQGEQSVAHECVESVSTSGRLPKTAGSSSRAWFLSVESALGYANTREGLCGLG